MCNVSLADHPYEKPKLLNILDPYQNEVWQALHDDSLHLASPMHNYLIELDKVNAMYEKSKLVT